MMPENFPNALNLNGFNIGGGDILSVLMQVSFFGVLFFVSVSLFISFLHLIWYGTSATRSYITIFIFLVVAVPLVLFALKAMPEVALSINI